VEIFLAIGCGILIGSVLGFVGAGGALLAVPMMIYIFDMEPVQATTAALIVVFGAALAGLLPKLKKKEVLVREGLTIWALGLVTNIGGSYLLPHLSRATVITGFSIVLLSAGISMLLKPAQNNPERKVAPIPLVGISLVIGAMTGLFGIGGGFLAIPVLVLFYNVSPVKAGGTSLFIITVNTITGFIAHFKHWNDVEWRYPLIIAIVAIVVAQISSRRSSALPAVVLKRAFALLVFSIAIFQLVEIWIIS
jgi:uncharacterized membrane protein YfcA